MLIWRFLVNGAWSMAVKKLLRSLWRSAACVVLAVFVAVPTLALAQQVAVSAAWVRSTVAGQGAAAAYLELTAREPARLVGASTPLAGATELHQMVMDGGVMKMRPLPFLELPAGKTVVLRPGSYHFMLLELKQVLRAGEQVPLSLRIEGHDKQRFTLDVRAEVRGAAAASSPAPGKTAAEHAHHMHH